MKATIAAGDLKKLVAEGKMAWNGSLTQPLQNAMLLEAQSCGVLILTVSDLEYRQARLQRQAIVGEEGSFVVSARDFSETIRRLGAKDTVDLHTTEAGRLQLKSEGGAFVFDSVGEPGEFRTLAAEGDHFLLLTAETLAEALDKCLYATSPDETRPILTGVRFAHEEPEAALVLTATDTYRLAKVTLSAAWEGSSLEDAFDFIVSRYTLHVVRKLLGRVKKGGMADVSIRIPAKGEKESYGTPQPCVEFTLPQGAVTGRTIYGVFPNIAFLLDGALESMNEDTAWRLEVDAPALQALCTKAIPIARADEYRVRLHVEGNDLHITGDEHTRMFDMVVHGVACRGNLVGNGPQIAFDGRFLAQALTMIPGRIVLRGGDVTRPMLIEDDERVQLLMPKKWDKH